MIERNLYKEFLQYLYFGEKRVNYPFDTFKKHFVGTLSDVSDDEKKEFLHDFFENFYFIFSNEGISKYIEEYIEEVSVEFLLKFLKTYDIGYQAVQLLLKKVKLTEEDVIEHFDEFRKYFSSLPNDLKNSDSLKLFFSMTEEKETEALEMSHMDSITDLKSFSERNIILFADRFNWRYIIRDQNANISGNIESNLLFELAFSGYLIYKNATEATLIPFLRNLGRAQALECTESFIGLLTESMLFQLWGKYATRSQLFKQILDDQIIKQNVMNYIKNLKLLKNKKKITAFVDEFFNSNLQINGKRYIKEKLDYDDNDFRGIKGLEILSGIPLRKG